MKTPEQIADEAAQTVIDANGLTQEEGEDALVALGFAMGEEIDYEEALKRFALCVVEADRAQRENDGSVHAAVIEALKDRAGDDMFGEPNMTAAAWIEDEPDEFWEEFAGPMLDDLYGKFA